MEIAQTIRRAADQNEDNTPATAIHTDAPDEELYVPHLEVYIVNLYPAVDQEQNTPPQDPDRIQDRELEIRCDCYIKKLIYYLTFN